MAILSNTPPTASEFNALRCSCGWSEIDPTRATRALNNSILHVTLREEGKTIAMGRVVGDGVMYFYLQDIVVAPDHRGKGHGRTIVDRIMTDLAPLLRPGCTVGLMAAHGVEPLYEAAGFTARPNDTLGAGMTIFP